MSRWDDFEKELEQLINKHSIDNACSTPDFILSRMVREILESYSIANDENIKWHGWVKLGGNQK